MTDDSPDEPTSPPEVSDVPASPGCSADVAASASRRRRWVIALAAAGSVSALVVVGALAFRPRAEPAGTSTAARAFALPALDGHGTVRLSQFRGKPVVVNLFASWCDVCDLELPGYAKLATELHGTVAFVGVDSMETGDPRPMVARNKISAWPLARDAGPTGRGLHDALAPGFSGMPITAFYDSAGKLLRVHRGGLLEDDLRSTLDEVYGKR
jgi:cytochrome c biogenesis protein CcmG/thiol:disulfide interchange protein DsbE